RQRTVRIGGEIAEDSIDGARRVEQRQPVGLIDRLIVVDLLPGPASEEESLVLDYRTSGLKSILVELDIRLDVALRVAEKLVRVKRGIAQKLEYGAVELVRASARGDGNGSAAVAAFLRAGIAGSDLVLLHVVRVQTVEVRDRIR